MTKKLVVPILWTLLLFLGFQNAHAVSKTKQNVKINSVKSKKTLSNNVITSKSISTNGESTKFATQSKVMPVLTILNTKPTLTSTFISGELQNTFEVISGPDSHFESETVEIESETVSMESETAKIDHFNEDIGISEESELNHLHSDHSQHSNHDLTQSQDLANLTEPSKKQIGKFSKELLKKKD
jgi:hypothetical protein